MGRLLVCALQKYINRKKRTIVKETKFQLKTMNDTEKLNAIKKELEDVEEYDSLEEAVCTLRRIVNIVYNN